MLDLSLQVFELLDRVENEFHKLTCRGLDDLRAEIEVLVERLDSLSHDIAKRGHHKCLDVLRSALVWLDHSVSDKFLAPLELVKDVVRAWCHRHVVAELLLCRQYYVTHLAEVLNNDIRVVVPHEKQLS